MLETSKLCDKNYIFDKELTWKVMALEEFVPSWSELFLISPAAKIYESN